MATKPTKPSHVNVKALREVVQDLQALQSTVNDPPPSSFDAIGTEIMSDLAGGSSQDHNNGFTDISGIDDINSRYKDNVTVLNQAWPDVKSGITALIGMLNETIAKHTSADDSARDGAKSTNTGQSSATPMGAH